MDQEQIFFEKIKALNNFHMPRWKDLPEIDLYMDQVISVTDKYLGAFFSSGDPVLTPSMINNYVKNEVIPPPCKKKYSREHLAKLIVICILKPVMEISAISYIMKRIEKLYGVQKMLDSFSEGFEKRIFSLVPEIESAFDENVNNEEVLCSIATENAIKAGTEKIMANYAYMAFYKEPPAEKSDKKKEKAKDKSAPPQEVKSEK